MKMTQNEFIDSILEVVRQYSEKKSEIIISDNMIKELRERTDEPLNKCRKALDYSLGDMDKAQAFLMNNWA